MCRSRRQDDPIGGSVPGAADVGTDSVVTDREDRTAGKRPGANDSPDSTGRADLAGEAFPGAVGPTGRGTEILPVLPFAAKPYEPPAPISATVARPSSGRIFLIMLRSFVWCG